MTEIEPKSANLLVPLRIIAIDWSGAASGARSKIWLAEAAESSLVQLRNGWTRDELAEFLIAEAHRTPELVVGIDFAFSLPAWFLEERGLRSAPELWSLASREAEDWIACCDPPFWGRPGKTRPALRQQLRSADREVPAVAGIRPKSVFQIGGAGAVGTGSLRGMPVLERLREAGFAIWPFDEPRPPLVIEIYPRLLTGAVNKGDPSARRAYLRERHPSLSPEMTERAAGSEDAFDAAVSALVMDAARDELANLPALDDPASKLEGWIWRPLRAPSTSIVSSKRASPSDTGLLLRAIRFAADKHRDQRRKDAGASPYINHPIAVAELLANIGGIRDLRTLVGAVLHDTVEDTETTPEELEQHFGRDVRALVSELTDDKSLPKGVRKQLQIEHAATASARAKAIKLGDKICNVIDVTSCPPPDWSMQRRREYLEWSIAVVDGCRGTNPALERYFDEVVKRAREVLVAS